MQHFADDPKLRAIASSVHLTDYTPSGDVYGALIEAIGSQQLSVKAADTIIARLKAHYGGDYPAPDKLCRTRTTTLRNLGFSYAKADYLRGLAKFALAGGLADDKLAVLPDDEAVDYLTQIKGVGRWTAEVVLMFHLGRPDVFPADDLGIQQAMIMLYDLQEEKKALLTRMHQIAEAWRPQRTLACRYLWAWRHVQLQAQTQQS